MKSPIRVLLCCFLICGGVLLCSSSPQAGVTAMSGAVSDPEASAAEESAPIPSVSSVPVSTVPQVSSSVAGTESESSTQANSSGIVYLTFDDGPSDLTIPLLDVLDQYCVKATFFVVGNACAEYPDSLREIVKRGHAVGNHSYTHDYHKIYASSDAFFDELEKTRALIRDTTGADTKLCRLPGGSVNDYNRSTRKAIIHRLKEEGYAYYDWNVSSGDASASPTPESIYSNVMKGVHNHRNSVVLMHNSSAKKATLEQMPRLLQTLRDEGYTCRVLDPSVENGSYIF